MHKILFYNKFIIFLYMFRSSTFVLKIMRSKLYYTASGVVTPIGGRPVHRLIIIFINCNWVVTRWQWLFYTYTKYEIGY